MALNGHAPPGHNRPNDSASQIKSLKDWLETHGRDDYDAWKHDNPTQHLSYEDWKVSNHVYGPYLYYATLQVWSESDQSDDDAETIDVETRSRGARLQSRRGPKKTVTTNGTRPPRVAGSATPSASVNAEELSASAKRKRKPRKKYLSQEIVASDDDTENIEASSFITDTATPTVPVAAADGRRKSGSRKPRKKPISEETISPEDEEDDPMSIDQIVPPAVDSPLPVRSTPKAQSLKRDPETSKTTTPKSSIVKKTKKSFVVRLPFHSWDAVVSGSKSRQSAFRDEDSDAYAKQNTAAASPDPNARRGLRMRRPAQQRPYFHDAQLFEDADTSPAEPEGSGSTSPASGSRRLSITPFTRTDDEGLVETPGESMADLEHFEEGHDQRQRHFKGKGRAWKKDESDEDEEFTPKRKAAKAKADAQASGQKKRGRPRKIPLAEDAVRDHSTSGTQGVGSAVLNKSPTSTPTQPQKRGRGRPRKSALSAELVQDDSSEDGSPRKKQNTVAVDVPTPPPATPSNAPKKRGRPRKSDQNTTPVLDEFQPAESNQIDGNGIGAGDNDSATKPAKATPKPTLKESEASATTASDANVFTEGDVDGSLETHANASTKTQVCGSPSPSAGTSLEMHVDKPGIEIMQVDQPTNEKSGDENMDPNKPANGATEVDKSDGTMEVDERVEQPMEDDEPIGQPVESDRPSGEATQVDRHNPEATESDNPGKETMVADKPDEKTKEVETTTKPVGDHPFEEEQKGEPFGMTEEEAKAGGARIFNNIMQRLVELEREG